MRVYGRSESKPDGTPEDPMRCIVQLFGEERIGREVRYVERQCSRKRGYGAQRLFCKQHSEMTSVDVPDAKGIETVSVSPQTLQDPWPPYEPPSEPASSSNTLAKEEELFQIKSEIRFAVDLLQNAVTKAGRIVQEVHQRLSRM